jgi:WD40 repeat protein
MIELSNGSLASASVDTTIKIWNTKTKTRPLLHSFDGHTDSVFGLEQLSNDGVFSSGSQDQTIKIWNANTRKLTKTIVIGEHIRSFIWLRNGDLAVVVQSKLKILNSNTELVIRTISNDNFEFMWLLPDGNLIIAQTDSNISIWDVNRWELLRTLKGHKKEIHSMELLDDGCLVSGSEDGEIKIWDPIKGRLLRSIKYEDVAVRSISTLGNGRFVSVSSGVCKFWK